MVIIWDILAWTGRGAGFCGERVGWRLGAAYDRGSYGSDKNGDV